MLWLHFTNGCYLPRAKFSSVCFLLSHYSGWTSLGSHSTPQLQPSTPSSSISVTPSPPATHQLLTNTPLTAALQGGMHTACHKAILRWYQLDPPSCLLSLSISWPTTLSPLSPSVLPPSVIVSALADSRATTEAGTDKPATPGDAPATTVSYCMRYRSTLEVDWTHDGSPPLQLGFIQARHWLTFCHCLWLHPLSAQSSNKGWIPILITWV